MSTIKRLLNVNGSALIFSIIILSIILVTSLSVVSVSVLERKSSGSTARSVQSFNVAQSGVEMALYQFNKNSGLDGPDKTINNLALALNASCFNGTITLSDVAGGNVTFTFKNSAGAELDNCDALLSDIAAIRSLGTANGTSRAVEVAVAAGSQTGVFSAINNNVTTRTPRKWSTTSSVLSNTLFSSDPTESSVTIEEEGDYIVISSINTCTSGSTGYSNALIKLNNDIIMQATALAIECDSGTATVALHLNVGDKVEGQCGQNQGIRSTCSFSIAKL